jgi:hypothetical protein
MNLRPGTIFFIWALILAIAIYDVIALLRGGRATISSVIITASYSPPWGALIPLAIGIVLGHLLVPQRAP